MLTREDIILNAPRFSESIVLSPLFVLAKVINRNTFIFNFPFFPSMVACMGGGDGGHAQLDPQCTGPASGRGRDQGQAAARPCR